NGLKTWASAKRTDPITAYLRPAWAFNGEGIATATGADKSPITAKNDTAYYWINHTYTHSETLDTITKADALTEIRNNDNYALSKDANFSRYLSVNLVTPDISG